MCTSEVKSIATPSLVQVTSGKGAAFSSQGIARDALERSVELEGLRVMVGSSNAWGYKNKHEHNQTIHGPKGS